MLPSRPNGAAELLAKLIDRNHIQIRWARPEDVESVAFVLVQAATWLQARGDPLWSLDELHPDAVRADVFSGLYAVAELGGRCVGVARVTEDDPQTWPEAAPGDAIYVHRLAVLRSHATGLVSRPMLGWCREQARLRTIPLVRLDCDARRDRLRQLYDSFGFRFHSEAKVGPHRVARFELVV